MTCKATCDHSLTHPHLTPLWAHTQSFLTLWVNRAQDQSSGCSCTSLTSNTAWSGPLPLLRPLLSLSNSSSVSANSPLNLNMHLMHNTQSPKLLVLGQSKKMTLTPHTHTLWNQDAIHFLTSFGPEHLWESVQVTRTCFQTSRSNHHIEVSHLPCPGR